MLLECAVRIKDAFFFRGGGPGKKDIARTFGKLPHDCVRGRGTAELRETAVANVVHDLCHLVRGEGRGGRVRKLNTFTRRLLEFVKRGARGGVCARSRRPKTYRQTPWPGVFQNLVTRVLDRPLLERSGALVVAHLLAHRTRGCWLKNRAGRRGGDSRVGSVNVRGVWWHHESVWREQPRVHARGLSEDILRHTVASTRAVSKWRTPDPGPVHRNKRVRSHRIWRRFDVC